MRARPHPHIGLATVTYLFEGGIFHRDSLGYEQAIRPGDVNWMTAGSGIAHSERTEPEMKQALERIQELKERIAKLSVDGHRQYNPGWHLALDLPHMLLVSECVARAALERQESRGGHTRDDFPAADAEWAKINLICTRADDGDITITRQPLPQMPADLAEIFEESS